MIDLREYQRRLWPHRAPARCVSVQVHPGVGYWPTALEILEYGVDVVLPVAATEVLVASYSMPSQNYYGSAMYVGGFVTGSRFDEVSWSVKRNGTPMLQFPAGLPVAPFGLLPYEHMRIYFSLSPGTQYELFAVNTSNATATVSGVLRGRRWIGTDVEDNT